MYPSAKASLPHLQTVKPSACHRERTQFHRPHRYDLRGWLVALATRRPISLPWNSHIPLQPRRYWCPRLHKEPSRRLLSRTEVASRHGSATELDNRCLGQLQLSPRVATTLDRERRLRT